MATTICLLVLWALFLLLLLGLMHLMCRPLIGHARFPLVDPDWKDYEEDR